MEAAPPYDDPVGTVWRDHLRHWASKAYLENPAEWHRLLDRFVEVGLWDEYVLDWYEILVALVFHPHATILPPEVRVWAWTMLTCHTTAEPPKAFPHLVCRIHHKARERVETELQFRACALEITLLLPDVQDRRAIRSTHDLVMRESFAAAGALVILKNPELTGSKLRSAIETAVVWDMERRRSKVDKQPVSFVPWDDTKSTTNARERDDPEREATDGDRRLVSQLKALASQEQWEAVEKRAYKETMNPTERKRLERFRKKACRWVREQNIDIGDRRPGCHDFA